MLRRAASVPGRATSRRCAVRSRSVAAGLVAGLIIPALLLVGCGSSDVARPAVCRLKAQQAIARDLGISTGTINYARSVGSNGMPQCAFTARAASHRVLVLVNVDDGPQAYFRLLRTVNEATQIFGPPPPGFHPPQGLSGLGPFASWFPNTYQLMATNSVDLVTAAVTWPGAGRNRDVAVARAAVVPYLAHPRGHGNTNDYP
ncbi:MAG TPA: hypothetical protein VHV75_06285 [Solirubrobacteraceae bacterium]|jgi:hypothetical protein|nr:hypothetical protein [Solirubrobacteraceae bacterium]